MTKMTMELYEVMSPHVAIPVIGVLVFAFLLFAFGFKAPVQPPSFDFDEDRRQKKSKKLREKPKTSFHSNGHIHSNTEDSKVRSTTKVSTLAVNRHRAAETEQRSKISRLPEPTKNTTVAKNDASPEDDDGEWTTFVSRKEKKLRNRKEEEEYEREAPVAAVAPEVTDISAPQPRKPKKVKKLSLAEECCRQAMNELDTKQTVNESVAIDREEGTEINQSDGAEKVTEHTVIPDDDDDVIECPAPEVKHAEKKESSSSTTTLGPTPPIEIFDITIDIQSLERKTTFTPTLTPPKATKPLKNKRDKKEKAVRETKERHCVNTHTEESNPAAHVIPNEAVPCLPNSIENPPTQISGEPNQDLSSIPTSTDDSWTEAKPKVKKKKARKDN